MIKKKLYDPLNCQQGKRLSYVAASIDAQKRLNRGERQVFCSVCKRYRWQDSLCARGKYLKTIETE